MKAYSSNLDKLINYYKSSIHGLSLNQVANSKNKYGKNEVAKPKRKGILKRIIESLSDPMMIILEIATFITLGVNVGKAIKGVSADFFECAGIIISIIISATLTVVMEGKSQKAFELLNSAFEQRPIKVRRNGEVCLVSQTDIVCGDVMVVEHGDKIVADGRIISCNSFETDESMLTGESNPVKKEQKTLPENTPLAERVNMVYSGTLVTSGNAEILVTAVGDSAEIGLISHELELSSAVSQPLQEKLERLGKLIASLGIISAVFVLILTIARLFATNNVTFDSVQNAFLSAIVLIVASVPEGLPTTVAIALTLNVIKLYKSNALIKKLVAAETVGCVSVICSDKTGTLTENKMKVIKTEYVTDSKFIDLNIAINSTADIKNVVIGQPTETALLKSLKNSINYNNLRQNYQVLKQTPFSSNIKYMSSTIIFGGKQTTFFKGAPEIIIDKCSLSNVEKERAFLSVSKYENEGKRVIAFCHEIENEYTYDGFCVIADSVRKDVLQSINECKTAGISVIMLTGDNYKTAYSISKELGICSNLYEVASGAEIDSLEGDELKEKLKSIKVVARSTPKTKLKVVTCLKEMGEVVAVTGDGVNDAPAIKHADIGIAMGSGSEVSKEASDIVLLDNSFSTIIKAISFGRNIFQNFQRFIMFQLSVNATAVLFIIVSLLFGLENPFTTVELLWVNIIMDGPPALTLGLESRGNELMTQKPVKRTNNLITKRMLIKIIVNAMIMCAVLGLQYKFNFLKCTKVQMKTVLFTLFILFQLFNAFNCRELGSKSVFTSLKDNKPMLIVFGITFLLQILLSECFGAFFGTVKMPITLWLGIVLTAFTIIVLSEIYKLIYRKIIHSKKISLKSKKVLIKM